MKTMIRSRQNAKTAPVKVPRKRKWVWSASKGQAIAACPYHGVSSEYCGCIC